MELITLNNNSMAENAYLYFDPQTKNGVVIDPGDNEKDIMNAVEANGIILTGILLTHGHYDHLCSANEIKAHTKAPIVCHTDEKVLLEDPQLNLSVIFGKSLSVTPDKELADGDEIKIGGGILKTIHTPGHSPGGICFYAEANGKVFTGDTLFRESIGRSDLYMGNHDQLIASIKQKLMTLPEHVRVYPGHGFGSTVGHERVGNLFVL